MDLNDLPAAAPAPKLRIMRLHQPPVEVDLPVFEGGEALPDVEREPDWVDQLDEPVDEMDIDLSHLSPASRAAAEFTRDIIRNLPAAPPPGPPEGWERHRCVLDCGFHVDVPPVELGVLGKPSVESMKDQALAEDLMLEHVEAQHGVAQLVAALQKARQSVLVAAAPAVTAGYEGVVSGPATRSPEKQAAVDALDARLGRSKAPPSPEEAEAYDNKLRAARDARRAQELKPTDLTPRYTADMEQGVVGIKR